MNCRVFLTSFVLALTAIAGRQVAATPWAVIDVTNSQYFRAGETYFRHGANPSSTSLSLGLKAHAEKRHVFGQFDFRNDYRAEEDTHYFKPFELVAGIHNDRVEFSVGRTRREWSVADEVWGMGLWQPRYMDDKLSRESAGLTGAFFSTHGSVLDWTLFATPVFIPDMGPNFELNDYRFSSQNPWFRPPGNEAKLNGVTLPVRYYLDRPSDESVINHGGVATQILWHPQEDRFARVSAGVLPMNQLMFAFPGTVMANPAYAQVRIKPRVIYHSLVTAETGLTNERGSAGWLSLSHEHPVRDDTPSDWTTQETEDAVIGAIYVSQEVSGHGPRASRIYASYLHVEGGDAPERGEFTSEERLFERRFMFQDALQVGGHHTGGWFSRRWQTHLHASATYDFAQHGILVSGKVQQPFADDWTGYLGADVLGLADRSGSIQDGFMSYYRANDRVGVGVQHAF